MNSKEIINNCLKYIDNNLEEQLNVTDIALYFGYSEYHFSRMFKSQMDVSVMEYVKKRKLIKASAAIIKGEKIIDVAFHYGWLSHSGFTKAFKQEFGFSPALLKAMMIQMDYCLGGNAMNHVFLNQTQVHATKEQLYDILKELYNKVDGVQAENELEKIYQFSCQCYEGQKRYSGDEYITHPINVAIILAQMEADKNTILAGLFCDILKKTEISVDTLKANIPVEVVRIVAGLNNFNVNQENIADNEGVTMVKLAEQLHNMRTVEFMDDKKMVIKAKETLDLFMPIARKIGNEKLIEELNDLALKYA